MLLFILSVNPLSFLLIKLKGYSLGTGNNQINVTHNFFVDDLKLYGSTLDIIKRQLDLVTTFSADIGMKFGEDKCAVMRVEKGKIINSDTPLKIDNLKIKPIIEGETYKYLGQDEKITYSSPVNKERVSSEYFKRIPKIWKFELSAFNKQIVCNCFAVPVLTPTFGILDWAPQDVKDIYIRTRKILNMTSNFNRNSDIDCLYIPRSTGGRGLRSFQTAHDMRIISFKQHLENNKSRSAIMEKMNENKTEKCIRVGNELLAKINITSEQNELPRSLRQKYLVERNKEHLLAYEEKEVHSYYYKKLKNDGEIDIKASLSWTLDKNISSEFEGYVFSVQEQEISTKYLINKRYSDGNNIPQCDNKCRPCKDAVEDIQHIISSCPIMSSRYYLPMRHDIVAKASYNTTSVIIKNRNVKRSLLQEPDRIFKHKNDEFWWDIKTSTNIKHNKPDMVICNHKDRQCTIIEFSCPADINIGKQIKEKIDNYGPLIRNLQIMYQNYDFKSIPIIIGAMRYVPTTLSRYLTQKQSQYLTRILQSLSISGTVKIFKTFLKFNKF